SADFFTGKIGDNKAAMLTSSTDALRPGATASQDEVKTAAVTSTLTKTGVVITPDAASSSSVDPVQGYVDKGNALPDYITDASKPVAAAATSSSSAVAPVLANAVSSVPASPVLAKPDSAPVQVAAIDPAPPLVAPVPFPARPAELDRPVAALPSGPVVIVDEPTQQQAALDQPPPVAQQAGPVPPADIVDDSSSWRNARLQRYLERNGLIDDASSDGRSSASVTVVERPSDNYDPDGFYLNDGPNTSRAAARRARLDRLFDDDSDDDDSDYTVF
ncbi:MAG TPA: hypothetical protein VHZ56_11075, partial [Devosia sp.]|nr:hypothetical protein [Devosia sp.]